MRRLWMLLSLASLTTALTACADNGFEEEESTVTYSYEAAADYPQVLVKADEYCEEKYGGEPGYAGNAEVVDTGEEDGDYQVTFICV